MFQFEQFKVEREERGRKRERRRKGGKEKRRERERGKERGVVMRISAGLHPGFLHILPCQPLKSSSVFITP